MSRLKILTPGFLTTVQDSGRYGYRNYGMPLSGAMDFFSHMTGNLLTGNSPGEASLEITLTGPEIEFSGRTNIAVTGAEMNPMINGVPIPMWQSINVGRKDRLTFQYPLTGSRAYLSVAGGIKVQHVMGSSSTYIRAKTGGCQGRRLEAGDILETGHSLLSFRKNLVMPPELIPEWRNRQVLGVMPGTDSDSFPEESYRLFYGSDFTITNNSDRMGIRLSGTVIRHRDKADVISYPIFPGVIQVPGDGNPVIMLADSQTVGGYAQIAVIMTAVLYKTGQLKPGDTVKFEPVGYADATARLSEIVNDIDKVFGRPGKRVTMERYRRSE